jgi:uncharacterized protein involved in exopolysaccharide biosynthesis
MNQENNNDEIDLRVVFNSIQLFFSRVVNFFIHIIGIIKKRIALVVALAVAGLAAGFVLFTTARPYYASTVVLSSSTLRNDFCADLVNDIQVIVKDESHELTAKKLGVSLKAAKQIKKISFSNYDEKLQERYKDKDTIVLGLPFKINVEAYSNTVFDTLQTALVDYLENNEYALKRKEIRKLEIELKRMKLNHEIHDLDSIKNIVAGNMIPRGAISGFVFGQPIDPINIYKEGIKLFQDELDLRKELILINNIEIISPFSPREKPDFPKLNRMLFWGSLIGFILGLVAAIGLDTRKKSVN